MGNDNVLNDIVFVRELVRDSNLHEIIYEVLYKTRRMRTYYNKAPKSVQKFMDSVAIKSETYDELFKQTEKIYER